MSPSRSIIAALYLGLSPAVGLAQDAAPMTGAQAECAALASRQTGFDPARPPPPAAVPSARVAGSGSRARGAMAGAMIGGADGAAAGAVAGGVAQRSRSRRAARQHNEVMAQQQQDGRAAFDQAFSACMAHGGAGAR